MEKYITPQLLRFLLIACFITIIISFLIYSFKLVYPFIIAMLLAILLEPFVKLLEEKWKLKRTYSITLISLLFFSSILLMLYFIMQRIVLELSTFIVHVEDYVAKLHDVLIFLGQSSLLTKIEKAFDTEWNVNHFINLGVEKLTEISSNLVFTLLNITSQLLASFTYIATVSIIILLTTFFILKDRHLLIQIYKHIIPVTFQQSIARIYHYVKKSIAGIFKTHVSLAFLSSIICLIGFIFLKVEHLFLLSISIFFVELIPYVGLGIIFIPWIFYQFVIHDYFFTIALITLYMFIIITRQMIEPKFLAKNLGIHPLVTLLVLFISYQFAGLFGFIITPIILILLSSLYRANIMTHIFLYIKEGNK